MIDTFNKFMVGGKGERIVISRLPTTPLTKQDALLLAAYLVALSEETSGEFDEILDAVKGALCP